MRARCLEALPRRSNGKVDLPAVAALAAEPVAPPSEGTPMPDPSVALRRLYAEVLERDGVTDDDTFVGLGGDSLSYVEASLRLERLLGDVPADWHLRPLRELARTAPAPRRRGRLVETSVLLRALAIVLIVGSHADLFMVMGGAHVLLAVAGANLARFPLSGPRAGQGRRLLRSAGRVWAPTALWVGGCLALGGLGYRPLNLLLANGLLGPDRLGADLAAVVRRGAGAAAARGRGAAAGRRRSTGCAAGRRSGSRRPPWAGRCCCAPASGRTWGRTCCTPRPPSRGCSPRGGRERRPAPGCSAPP